MPSSAFGSFPARVEQLIDDVLRCGLVRIHVWKQHEVRQEHAPVLAEARQQPRPVDLLLTRADEVQHVGAVEALALHQERLRPDHLFDRHQAHREAQRFVAHALVNHSSSTSATPLPPEKIRSTKNSRWRPPYALPSQWGNVSSVVDAFVREHARGRVPVGAADEEIEILRVRGRCRCSGRTRRRRPRESRCSFSRKAWMTRL